MTAPRSTPAAHVTISNKTVPVLLGSFSGQMQIINNSATDIVWIGDSTALSAATGIPVQAQSALQYGSAQNYNVYAILDPNASAPVDLIIGGDASLWSPSPVKVVNISGPVTVSGTVSISGTVSVAGSVSISSGTVNVGTITGTVTITGPVTVTNTPGVIPQSNLVVQALGITGSQLLTNLDIFASVILKWTLSSTSGTFSDASIIQVSGYPTSNGSGLALWNYNYYIQDTSGDTKAGLVLGASGFTVIPLNGCKSLQISFTPGHSPGDTITIDAYASNLSLQPTHRTNTFNGGPWLYNRGSRLAIPTGTTYQIPIPVTNNGVTIYLYSSGTGTGTPKTTVTITDQLSNILRTYVALNIVISTELANVVLPHSLNPQYLSLQETGVAGTTSQWEIIIIENALPAVP